MSRETPEMPTGSVRMRSGPRASMPVYPASASQTTGDRRGRVQVSAATGYESRCRGAEGVQTVLPAYVAARSSVTWKRRWQGARAGLRVVALQPCPACHMQRVS